LTSSNYAELVALDGKLGPRGLQILAFPSNEFGGQEPGTDAEIAQFAAGKGASFPVFSKVRVNGADCEPLYAFLKAQKGEVLGAEIKWNFAKFLVDGRTGQVVHRYVPTTSPSAIEPDILALL